MSSAKSPAKVKKSKTAHNGESHFDLSELSQTVKADQLVSVDRSWLATLVSKTAKVCDVSNETLVVGAWSKPLARGYMLKRGKIVKSWKRRYFVLSGRHLVYCQSEASTAEEPPIGIIFLKDVTVGVDEGHVREIARRPIETPNPGELGAGVLFSLCLSAPRVAQCTTPSHLALVHSH
jgi:hypothetical protein